MHKLSWHSAAREDQFFQPPCWTADTAAPLTAWKKNNNQQTTKKNPITETTKIPFHLIHRKYFFLSDIKRLFIDDICSALPLCVTEMDTQCKYCTLHVSSNNIVFAVQWTSRERFGEAKLHWSSAGWKVELRKLVWDLGQSYFNPHASYSSQLLLINVDNLTYTYICTFTLTYFLLIIKSLRSWRFQLFFFYFIF